MSKILKSFYSKVAGVTRNNDNGESRQAILEALNVGERLILQRDLFNEYDSNAIEIYTENWKQIGFINRNVAEEIAPLMDDGYKIEAIITDITGGHENAKSYGCNFKLTVYDDIEVKPLANSINNVHKNVWDYAFLRVFYSKPAVIIIISVLAIINLLLSMVFGIVYFLISEGLTFLFFKMLSNQRKSMLQYLENKKMYI